MLLKPFILNLRFLIFKNIVGPFIKLTIRQPLVTLGVNSSSRLQNRVKCGSMTIEQSITIQDVFLAFCAEKCGITERAFQEV